MTGTSRDDQKTKTERNKELTQRIGSAIVLAVLACLATYAGPWPFTLMIAAGSVILAREWALTTRRTALDPGFYIHAASAVAACILTAMGQVWLALSIVGAGACAAALASPKGLIRAWPAFGVLFLSLPCLLLVLFRFDQTHGLAVIFFFYLVVWSADTAAFFCGRAFGGPKLAPRISPGKTWSGFAGGLLVPTMLSTGFALWLGGGASVLFLAMIGAALATCSQLGDLAESAIKRNFQVKDTGQLLPGHGGLFDRVDGLIGAVLGAGAIASFRDFLISGKSLLLWP